MSRRTELARGWIAIHNGDYSGDVEFVDPASGTSFAIPFDIIAELVAEVVRQSAIRNLEHARLTELLPGLDPECLSGGPEVDAARPQTKAHDGAPLAEESIDREQTTEPLANAPRCIYCDMPTVVDGVCRSCRYDIGNVNGRRCVEHVVLAASEDGRCPNDMLGISQHCAAHQRKHVAVEDESVSEPRCAVCLEPAGYPIHKKLPVS